MIPLKVLDLFAGGGGFSAGFMKAHHPSIKFEIIKAVEIDQAACNTLSYKLGEDRIIKGDITKSNIKKKIYNSCSDVDVVIGGPPCQTFSLVGPARSGSKEMREKLKNDPRNTLYKHFIEIVDNIKPKFVVFENVEGMLSKRMNGIDSLSKKQVQVVDLICDELESIGYTTRIENSISDRFQVLNAVDLGVPQQRKRIIIIANRLGVDNPRVEPSHGVNNIPFQTINNAISHLPVRLPKITITEKLKNVEVIRDNYKDCLSDFMNNLHGLAIKEVQKNTHQGIYKLYVTLNELFLDIKNKKSYKFHNLKKFVHFYNELIEEHQINKFKDNKDLTSHQSRIHNFRDVIIFIKTKQGSNSSRFMNPASDDYNQFLDSLYPYCKNKHKDTYVKHCWEKPSNTILAHMEKDGLKFIHPEQPRSFTPYEAQLLQSFPQDYVFYGGRNDQYRQIGNAVPPKLAKAIGESVLETYIQYKALKSKKVSIN